MAAPNIRRRRDPVCSQRAFWTFVFASLYVVPTVVTSCCQIRTAATPTRALSSPYSTRS